MGQQNLGFVERHVEKLAMGVGGLMILVAVVMVFSGSKASYSEAAIASEATKVEQRLAGAEPSAAGVKIDRTDEVKRLMGAVMDAPVPPGALAMLGTAGPGTWDRPSPRVLELIIKPGDAFSGDLTPPAPETLDAAPALGFASKTRGAPKEEFRAVQLRLELDAKATYKKWWPIYDFLRQRTIEDAKKAGIAPKDYDFRAAEEDFAFRWRLIVFGLEIEKQTYNHITGWSKDANGNDDWQPVKVYGQVGEKEWIKKLVESQTDDKFPPFTKRKEPAAQAKFEATRDDLVTLYSTVRQDVQWPTPPGPDGVEVFKPNGDRNVGNARNWMLPPKQSGPAVTPTKEAKEGPKTPGKTVVDVDEIRKPTKPKVDNTPAKTEDHTKDAVLKLDDALKMRLGDGSTRAMSAFIFEDLYPGETYRFRARVLVRNPAFEWGELAVPTLENQFFLATDWTKPSVPVTIPETTRFYVLSGEKYGDGENQVNKPLIQIFRWYQGNWYATRNVRIAPGEIIRPERKEDLIRPTGGFAQFPFDVRRRDAVESALAMFDTGCVLLDVREQGRLFDRQPNRAANSFGLTNLNKTRITYLDAAGVIRSQWAAYDKLDLAKWSAK